MDEPYRYEVLPLDTPDDDPRWAEYLDVLSLGFLDRRAAEANVATYRKHRREDQAILGMVTTEGPGLAHRQPVAVFACGPFTINTGRGVVPSLVVNTIAVRPSHRRRGLLSTMMRRNLTDARDRGVGTAVLTASEATIYGRYGFGVTNRQLSIQVDTKRFAFRAGVPLAEGAIEFVDPSFLEPHFGRIAQAHQERYRGAGGRLGGHFLTATGAWDREDEGPSRSLRCLVHFDTAGEPDGFALFKHKGWDTTPITTSVIQVCSPDPAIDRVLWQALASIDLVERLEYGFSHPGDPLPHALVDQWAVKVTEETDAVWLRILDLEVATAQRGFESDGSIVLGITDRLGWCDGAWRITATDGIAVAERTDDEPEVSLGIDTLASVWLGDRTISTMALAGLVTGEDEAVQRASRLFGLTAPPVNLAGF